jgi:uroporphyrinogen-III synthase
MQPAGFGGRLVVGFESRRAAEMASLIERHGGAPVSAPSLREVAVDAPDPARELAGALLRGTVDVVVFLTGVGVRGFVDAAVPLADRAAFVATLGEASVIARGPKPARALRELGVSSFVTVAAPNTHVEVLAALDALGSLRGRRVAVQEYGVPNEALYEALRSRGALVLPLALYRYALPEDTTPLRSALHRLAKGEIPIALFTSRSQVEHVLVVAADEGIEAPVRAAFLRGLVGSIGPVCSEALRHEGLDPDVEPEHHKMGHLVKEAAARADAILSRKGDRAC